MQIQHIPIDQLNTDKYRTRQIGKDDVSALQNSIGVVGILQPVLVEEDNGVYYVIAGHRRLEALKASRAKEVWAVVLPADEPKAVQAALTENLVRKALHPLDRTYGFKTLLDLGSKQAEIANLFGLTKGTVSNQLKVLELHHKVLEAVKSEEISFGVAKALLPLEDYPEAQQKVLSEFLSLNKKEQTVRQAEIMVKRMLASIYYREGASFNFALPDKVSLQERAKSWRLTFEFESETELQSQLDGFIKENKLSIKDDAEAVSGRCRPRLKA